MLFLFVTHVHSMIHMSVKLNKIIPMNLSHTVKELWPRQSIFSQGQKAQKQAKPELSILFATHSLDMIYIPVKLHESILYG